jgi:hypothetical protein
MTLMEARLCRELTRGSRWICESIDAPSTGRIYFYTRVLASSPADIEHVWYQGDRLVQRVSLKVTANPVGYRTYSQQTVETGSGAWRVELRSPDGSVLAEERFDVP